METFTAPAASSITPLVLCMRLAQAQAHASMIRSLDHSLGEQFGISFADFQILFHLDHAPHGHLRRMDLADCLAISASGVTRALLPVEKIAVVLRQSDPSDVRVSFTTLSAAGLTLLHNAQEFSQQFTAMALPWPVLNDRQRADDGHGHCHYGDTAGSLPFDRWCRGRPLCTQAGVEGRTEYTARDALALGQSSRCNRRPALICINIAQKAQGIENDQDSSPFVNQDRNAHAGPAEQRGRNKQRHHPKGNPKVLPDDVV